MPLSAISPIAPWGLDLSVVLNRIALMEETIMTTQAEAFAALSAQISDISADFAALLAQLAVERENLSEAGQAALAELEAKVTALDDAVGDADGSDNPPPAEEPPVAEEPPAV